MAKSENIDRALQLHRSGKLAEAKNIYQQILQDDPNNPIATHFLGVICHQSGNNEMARDLIMAAIQQKPDYTDAHNNLGTVLVAMGKIDEAISSYKNAFMTNSADAKANHQIGTALQQHGQLEDALACYKRAIEINPDFIEAHNNLGVALKNLGRSDEAMSALANALQLNPKNPQLLNNMGNVQSDLNEMDGAIASYAKALSIDPDFTEAHCNMGRAFMAMGRASDAINSYNKALEIDPEQQEAKYLVAALSGKTLSQPPREYISNLFDNFSRTFDIHLSEHLKYNIPRLLLNAVTRTIGNERTFPQVIDLGCGTGLSGFEFRPIAGNLMGIDLSPGMLEKAKTKRIYDDLVCGDIVEELKQNKQTIDLFIATDVFIYVGDLEPVFEAISARAAKNSLFCFSIELIDDDDYLLTPSGRYAHSSKYVHDLAEKFDFIIKLEDNVVIRIENNIDVNGKLFVLSH